MFIGQVLSVDHSCRDAIARLNVWRVAQGLPPCESDTSAYCEARKRLPEELVLKLALDTGLDCAKGASSSWLWMNRTVKIVDGFAVTMPDTAENQQEYPQSTSQKPGVGFPIIRAVMIFNTANPCRCPKKTQGFIHACHVDPSNMKFALPHVSTIRNIAIDTYAIVIPVLPSRLTAWRYKGWIQFRRIATHWIYWTDEAEMACLRAITKLLRNGSIKAPKSLTQPASQMLASHCV